MSAVRMDGKALSAKVRGSILAETEELKKQGVTPGLAVIIVGNDPASEIYVRNKERACEQCGFYSEKYALPEETTQEELLGLIAQLNESPAISAVMTTVALCPGFTSISFPIKHCNVLSAFSDTGTTTAIASVGPTPSTT